MGTPFIPGIEDKWVDAGRKERVSRETKLGANGDTEKSKRVYPVQLTTDRIGNPTRVVPNLLNQLNVMTAYLLHVVRDKVSQINIRKIISTTPLE